MKKTLCILLVVIVAITAACSKNSTGPQIVYTLADIVGNWIGTVENTSNTLNLNLNVDDTGKANGSGVSSTWSVSNTGAVTGGGSFSFIAGSSFVVASAGWNIQLSEDKQTLTGTFDVSYPSLHSMEVNLTKQ